MTTHARQGVAKSFDGEQAKIRTAVGTAKKGDRDGADRAGRLAISGYLSISIC